MLKVLSLTILAVVIGSIFGCADGNCRTNREKAALNNPGGDGTTTSAAGISDLEKKSDHVKVFKYDGSKQCGGGTVISTSDMQKDLGTITVFSSENKMDHLMHPMLCGTISGKANVYEIPEKDLPAAKKAGFKEWIW